MPNKQTESYREGEEQKKKTTKIFDERNILMVLATCTPIAEGIHEQFLVFRIYLIDKLI